MQTITSIESFLKKANDQLAAAQRTHALTEKILLKLDELGCAIRNLYLMGIHSSSQINLDFNPSRDSLESLFSKLPPVPLSALMREGVSVSFEPTEILSDYTKSTNHILPSLPYFLDTSKDSMSLIWWTRLVEDGLTKVTVALEDVEKEEHSWRWLSEESQSHYVLSFQYANASLRGFLPKFKTVDTSPLAIAPIIEEFEALTRFNVDTLPRSSALNVGTWLQWSAMDFIRAVRDVKVKDVSQQNVELNKRIRMSVQSMQPRLIGLSPEVGAAFNSITHSIKDSFTDLAIESQNQLEVMMMSLESLFAEKGLPPATPVGVHLLSQYLTEVTKISGVVLNIRKDSKGLIVSLSVSSHVIEEKSKRFNYSEFPSQLKFQDIPVSYQ